MNKGLGNRLVFSIVVLSLASKDANAVSFKESIAWIERHKWKIITVTSLVIFGGVLGVYGLRRGDIAAGAADSDLSYGSKESVGVLPEPVTGASDIKVDFVKHVLSEVADAINDLNALQEDVNTVSSSVRCNSNRNVVKLRISYRTE